MISGIYSAATSMDNAAQRHELVARNLASINVPGYRRVMLSSQRFEDSMNVAGAFDAWGTATRTVATDFTPGVIHQTGRSLDMAIDGDGFFAIEGPNEELYTRNGSFQINDEGRLVTSEGHPVAADSGTLTVPPTSSSMDLVVGRDGNVTIDGIGIGRIKIVRFEDPQRLELRGGTLMRAPAEAIPLPSDARIAQGVYEGSNISPVTELVEMIAATRAHEAAQRAMNTISKAIERHTNQATR